jgi:hypothetical protein
MKIRPATLALIGLSAFVLWLICMADAGRAQGFFTRVGQTPGADKLGHFVLYGGISFLANLVANARTISIRGRRVLKWSALLILLAALEEFSQLLFRSRNFDLLDLLAGMIGIWWLGRLAARRLESTPKPTLDQRLSKPDSTASGEKTPRADQAPGEA